MKAVAKPTGNAEVDRQHAILHEYANRFGTLCLTGKDSSCLRCAPKERLHCTDALKTLADGFLSLLAGHANYEEKLMNLLPSVQRCREHIRKHKASHAEFALNLKTLLSQLDEENPGATSIAMHHSITHWLGEHAQEFDEPLLVKLIGMLPTETEFDGELVSILDDYVFHGRPTGFSSHLHDNDTRQQVEARMTRLTSRQREVCVLVAKGLANKVIAKKLGTTVNTIKTHRAEIYRKLEVRSLLDLVLAMEIIKD